VGRLKNKDGELLEANMRMAWMLFDNRDSLGTRIYSFNKVLGEKAEQVLSQLAERLELGDGDDTLDDAVDDDGGFEIDLGDTAGTAGFAPLIKAIEDEGRRDEVFDELRAVCQTVLDTGQAAAVGKAALRAAQDANARLTEIDLANADPKTHDALSKQLEEIAHRAHSLGTKLQQIKDGGAQPSPDGA
jgi:hypothetical protein